MASGLELNFPNPVERRADLFDRTSQLELICETLASPARRIAVIMGERRTGKTSLLKVVQIWAAAKPGLAVLRLPPVASRRELMEEILDGITGEAGTTLDRLGYRDAAGVFTRPTVAGFAAVAAELSARANRTFVICIDELDSMLVNCQNEQSAIEILDFIMYVNNTSLPIKFVFTLTRATRQITRADATPFITAARIADLTPWGEQESREFVEWLLAPNLALDDSANDLLFAESGGHPYLIKAILQPIADAEGAGVTDRVISADRVRAGAAAALASLEVHHTLENIVNVHFSPKEMLILLQLARAPKPLTEADFASNMSAFRELRRRHYVRPAGDRFILAFGLLGRWLLAQATADSDHTVRDRHENGTGTARLVLDENRRSAFVGDREVRLTQQEYRFLRRLVHEPGTVIGRTALAAVVWPGEAEYEGGSDSRLSQLVHRLRTKLDDHDHDPKYIETRPGFGFSAVTQNVEPIRGGKE